jgi:hypothetical protein
MAVLLIDDVRRFRDERECAVARTQEAGLALVRAHRDARIDELWLDHDLERDGSGRIRTVMPVVDELVRWAADGVGDVGVVYVHSANPAGALAIRRALERAGYDVRRSHAPIWRHDFGSGT